MIIARTPFRISFFGGGTDYPTWYHKHGGAVLSTSFNKYTYITCRWLPPFFTHKYRVVYSKLEDVKTPNEIMHPAIRAIFSAYEGDKGIELHSDADLPARSGLGSSSAFLVGLLNAIEALHGRRASPLWLSKEAIRFEQDVLAEHVGSQDQVATAFGGLNVIRFGEDDSIVVEPVVLTRERKKELNDHLMLFFTGFSRDASSIAQHQINNMEKHSDGLHSLRKMIDDALSILTTAKDIRLFGEMLHHSWMCKRKFSAKITNNRIDAIYETARKAGAVGGKLLGAGGGGFILFFVEPSKQSAVRQSLIDLLHVPFEMENSGSQIIYYTE